MNPLPFESLNTTANLPDAFDIEVDDSTFKCMRDQGEASDQFQTIADQLIEVGYTIQCHRSEDNRRFVASCMKPNKK